MPVYLLYLFVLLLTLQKKQMSAGELASELVLRLNTLLYNLSLLKKPA
jgi:hypothetical protein